MSDCIELGMFINLYNNKECQNPHPCRDNNESNLNDVFLLFK